MKKEVGVPQPVRHCLGLIPRSTKRCLPFALLLLTQLSLFGQPSSTSSILGLFPLPGTINPLDEFDLASQSRTSLLSSFTYTGSPIRSDTSEIPLQRYARSMLVGVAYGGNELSTAFAVEHGEFSHGVLPDDDVITSIHLRRSGAQGWAAARYQRQDTVFVIHGGIGATAQIGIGVTQKTSRGSFGYTLVYGRQEADIDIVWPLLALGLCLELSPLAQEFEFRYRMLSLDLGYAYSELHNADAPYDISGRIDTWNIGAAVSPGSAQIGMEGMYHRASASLYSGDQRYGHSGTLQVRYGKADAQYTLRRHFSVGSFLELLDWRLDGKNFVSVLPLSPYGPLMNIRFRNIEWDGYVVSPGIQLTYTPPSYAISDTRSVNWHTTGILRYYELESSYAYELRISSPLTIYRPYSPDSGKLVSQWGLAGELHVGVEYQGRSVSARLELHQLIPLYDHDRLDGQSSGAAETISQTTDSGPNIGSVDTRGTTVRATLLLPL